MWQMQRKCEGGRKPERDGKREETHQQLDKNDYKQEETSKEKDTLCRD